MTLHERLKFLRINAELSQSTVAKFIGIGERTYQRYEYGERLPTSDVLIKLAKYFEVSVDYLLGLTDNPEIKR